MKWARATSSPSLRAQRSNDGGGSAQAWLIGGAIVLTLAIPSIAQSPDALSGDYVCAYGCRLSDANPSLAIDGETANCMNEFGGLFRGRALSATSIACFNKTGTLAPDGVTLEWSDGVIWKRHLGSAN